MATGMGEVDLNKERLELALEAAGLDLWENDLITGNVTRKATKTFEELGFTEEEIVSGVQDIYGLFHPDDIDTVRQAVADHLTGVTPQYRCEFRLRSKSGEWVWFANYGRIMDGHSDTPGKRLIGVTFNIHDRKCRETEIAQINQQLTEQNRLLQQLNATLGRLAANDSLTGLSNCRTLRDLGAKEAKRTKRFGHPMSLLVADIDLFKSVNDMYGHLAGDRVICAVAQVCAARKRSGVDIVARFGGEEFVIFAPVPDLATAANLADAIRQWVKSHLSVGQPPEPVTVSMGVCLSKGSENLETLLALADERLYRAKHAGRDCVVSD